MNISSPYPSPFILVGLLKNKNKTQQKTQ